MTRSAYIRLIKIVTTIIVVALISTFAIWRSLDYARGPSVTITEPINGSSISANSVMIKGVVERAKNMLLNGNEINIDEKGDFSETIIVFPGINLITLTAKDQFGRSAIQLITLVGNKADKTNDTGNIPTSTDTVINNDNASTTTP